MSVFECIELAYPNDSAQLFNKIRELPFAIYLDSCHPQPQGRYDVMTALPYITLTSENSLTTVTTRTDSYTTDSNPFQLIKAILGPLIETPTDLPFIGGALGYFGYDLGRYLEQLPELSTRDIDLPDMVIGIFDWAIVVDHHLQQCHLVSTHQDPQTKIWLLELQQQLVQPDKRAAQDFKITLPFKANMDYSQYAAAFAQIQKYIYAGDCYQVNFAQRFTATFSGSSWHAYQTLRQYNPVPFAAYLNLPQGTILSLSPERFLKVNARQVETKPIKGTRPRHPELESDNKLADSLLNSEKDRAENLMIVDLLRNDLGKTCQAGSIQVPHLFSLESYPSVHHLVSTITGELAAGKHNIDLLQGCFPGGSITGAPKLRAMEIIEELEPQRRSVYCGAIGYISFDGKMDTNIAIRTFILTAHQIHCAAGGGLVSDSQVATEYRETFDKITNMLTILEKINV